MASKLLASSLLSWFLVLMKETGAANEPCAVQAVPKTLNSNDNSNLAPRHYWRDYTGIIPNDALPGGRDKNRNPTFVGQVYVKDFELLPATISSGCSSVVTSAYNKEMHPDKNIKILCVDNPEEYKWMPVKNEEANLLTDCQLVIGGSEVGEILNIGRINYDGRVLIGKVFRSGLSNQGLWVPYNGHEEHFLTYEILTYNCDSD